MPAMSRRRSNSQTTGGHRGIRLGAGRQEHLLGAGDPVGFSFTKRRREPTVQHALGNGFQPLLADLSDAPAEQSRILQMRGRIAEDESRKTLGSMYPEPKGGHSAERQAAKKDALEPQVVHQRQDIGAIVGNRRWAWGKIRFPRDRDDHSAKYETDLEAVRPVAPTSGGWRPRNERGSTPGRGHRRPSDSVDESPRVGGMAWSDLSWWNVRNRDPACGVLMDSRALYHSISFDRRRIRISSQPGTFRNGDQAAFRERHVSIQPCFGLDVEVFKQ